MRPNESLEVAIAPSFRCYLANFLETTLKHREMTYINCEDFIHIFNERNSELNKRPLDTKGLEPHAFFKRLRDVCKIDAQGNLFPLKNRNSQPERQDDPNLQMHRIGINRAPVFFPFETLPIGHDIVAITNDLMPCEVALEQLLCCLDYKNREALTIFHRLSLLGQIQFIIKVVSERSGADISFDSRIHRFKIKLPPNYGNIPQHRYTISYPHSSAYRVDQNLKKTSTGRVVHFDHIPRKMSLQFFPEESAHHVARFHRFFKNFYRSYDGECPSEFYRGMPCVAQYDKGYQRAVVTRIWNNSHSLEVFFVDLGFHTLTDKSELRNIHNFFLNEPILTYKIVVSNSPPWETRKYFGRQLTDDIVSINVQKFDQSEGLYVAELYF